MTAESGRSFSGLPEGVAPEISVGTYVLLLLGTQINFFMLIFQRVIFSSKQIFCHNWPIPGLTSKLRHGPLVAVPPCVYAVGFVPPSPVPPRIPHLGKRRQGAIVSDATGGCHRLAHKRLIAFSSDPVENVLISFTCKG